MSEEKFYIMFSSAMRFQPECCVTGPGLVYIKTPKNVLYTNFGNPYDVYLIY